MSRKVQNEWEDHETVVATVMAGPNYGLLDPKTAEVTIRDPGGLVGYAEGGLDFAQSYTMYFEAGTPEVAEVAGPGEGAPPPPAPGQGGPTLSNDKVNIIAVVNDYKGMPAGDPKPKLRENMKRWFITDPENQQEVDAAAAKYEHYWVRVIKNGNRIIHTLQTHSRFAVDQFANAPDKDTSCVLQTVKSEMFVKIGNGAEKRVQTANWVEGFAVDGNGFAKRIDVRKALGNFEDTDVRVVLTFKAGWGKYKNAGVPAGSDGVEFARKVDGEIPAADYKFTGPTLDYTVTFTCSRTGQWTINDTGVNVTGSGGPTEILP